MLAIFPVIYISAFLVALKFLIEKKRQGFLIFLIFGLCIYNTVLSITFSLGFTSLIGLFKSLKELIVLLLLGIQIYWNKKTFRFQTVDYVVGFYLIYTVIYALLPIGVQPLSDRIASLKNIAFFPLLYLCGRLFDFRSFQLHKYYNYILYVTIAASVLVLYEFVTYQHFQTMTGYADYQYYFYDAEATGRYGLTFTFETDEGLKRFASFFASPLELAGSTLLSLAIIASISTTDENKIKLTNFGIVTLAATQICIFLAISRSSFISYFLMIYVYALVTKKRVITNLIYSLAVCGVLYFLFLLRNKEIQDFIISTINFSNPSSVGHIIGWIEGINSIISHPFGIGMGTSGILAGNTGENTGGENEFIIIGVQAGIIAGLAYLATYFIIIKTAWQKFPSLKGKERKLCLMVLLIKIGLLIPLFTSELEISSYISYLTWFFSGLFISVIASKSSSEKRVEKIKFTQTV
ncbi:hypothetical protein GS399_12155 [Pedobacter sp. HMF7647]|uniref:O-antigen ligase domain-containing protein n=1 Tax=Hufsiella arboris TaxID=2695275 RepID=A0A7K1YCF4_9SPHI|nr:O-antigen ligase family protein [Hufsiella arboris]MXV51728.1 hypothetical protein [Hufsiella arboris]